MHRPDHADAILRRAAQIEAERLDPAATLTDADLVEAGKAAGLSEEAVRLAITEQRLVASGTAPKADADLRWTFTRRVPKLTDGQRAEMFSTMRRAVPYRSLGSTTQIETFGEAQQLAFDAMGPWARLRIAPADATHDVWTYEHHATADVKGIGWWMPLLAPLLAFLPLMVLHKLANLPTAVTVALFVAVTVAAGLFAPRTRRWLLDRRRRQFDALSGDLDRLAAPLAPAAPVAEAASDPVAEAASDALPTPTPQPTLDAEPAPEDAALPERRTRTGA